MSDIAFARLLKRVVEGESLSVADSASCFAAVMSGNLGEAPIASLLTALAIRKPTVDEIVGAARAMREVMTTIEAPPGAIDLCGTGGDGQGTLNISTACSFVVAATGVPVAKHGNRNMSSNSGAADVLEALGANINISADDAAICLRDSGVCFLFAPSFHPAMSVASSVRRALGFRTIFNLLGPLTSPARVTRQLVGVYDLNWVEPLAEVLRRLGAESAWVVHGEDGLDEMTISGPTRVAVIESGSVRCSTVSPEDAGISRAPLDRIRGGSAGENADALLKLMRGEKGAYHDVVILNSAAALIVAGKVSDLRQGAKLATAALDSGAAADTLDRFIAATRRATR